ncbi:hypothetical protein HK102_014203 [Quaeritorhiza haematococci]|nr:hypothetical protein HK102_014203 [Quaeritorhiza haematococci]
MDRLVDHCPETVANFSIETWKEDDRDDDIIVPYDHNKFRRFFSQFETLALSSIPDRNLYVDGGHSRLRVAMLESGG